MCVLVIILLSQLYNLELNIEIFWEAREIMTLYMASTLATIFAVHANPNIII